VSLNGNPLNEPVFAGRQTGITLRRWRGSPSSKEDYQLKTYFMIYVMLP
jgi:hypothetical protein